MGREAGERTPNVRTPRAGPSARLPHHCSTPPPPPTRPVAILIATFPFVSFRARIVYLGLWQLCCVEYSCISSCMLVYVVM